MAGPGDTGQLEVNLIIMFEDLDPGATAQEKAEQMTDIISSYLSTVKVQNTIPVQVTPSSGTGATTSIANLQ